MLTFDEFEALKKNGNTMFFTIFDGVYRYKKYKTYDTDFGWCTVPKDDKAKESCRKNWLGQPVIVVEKANGEKQQILLGQRVFDDNPEIHWFEYGVKTLAYLKKECAKDGKKVYIMTHDEALGIIEEAKKRNQK